LPPGTLVEKINSLATDTHRDGAKGRVLEAVGPATSESTAPGTYGYWVEFAASGLHPIARVFVAGSRLRPILG
jgi:hypothetical protein